MDLSVLIPARNERWLGHTIRDVLSHVKADTEVIAVCDGQWPDPPVDDDPRLVLLHHATPIGQRAAVNLAARYSRAKYVMKLDAHCAVDDGFDVKLIEAAEELGPDVTQIARMYNLHVFDWVCPSCGFVKYQGPTPTTCEKCRAAVPVREVRWKPRWHKRTDFARFDADLHFQYWGEYEKRPEAAGDLADTMSSVGAMFFMSRERFWQLGGLDEAHGSWGQFGVEVALKSVLSGGRHVVNKRTWFAHLFRTQGGDFSFPYHLSQADVEKARKYSQDLWKRNKWPLTAEGRSLDWVLEKFAPVPGWHDASYVPKAPANIAAAQPAAPAIKVGPTKGLVYYSDCLPDPTLLRAVRNQLLRAAGGRPIVSVTLDPVSFGKNIVLPLERGYLTMFKQILRGLEELTTDVAFLVEHDVLYAKEHFEFTPRRQDVYYYNQSVWKVDVETGRALFYYCNQTSGLCANRELLVQHYRTRVERVEREGFTRGMGFEPGTHAFPRGIDNFKHEVWHADQPNVDLRHGKNLTPSRFRKDQFRNQKYTEGWTESDSVPGWGQTAGRMVDLLSQLASE